jgi:hypothetical protein
VRAMPKSRKEPQQQEVQKQQVSKQRKPPALASALSGAVSGAVISACVQVRLLEVGCCAVSSPARTQQSMAVAGAATVK